MGTREQRKQVLSVTTDQATVQLLGQLAAGEVSGNRSEMFRRLVQEGAERRGLLPVNTSKQEAARSAARG